MATTTKKTETRGRKKTYKDPVITTMKIEREIIEMVDEIAQNTERTRTQTINKMIKDSIKKYVNM